MISFSIPALMSVVTLNIPGLGCAGAYVYIVALGLIQAAELIKMELEKKAEEK